MVVEKRKEAETKKVIHSHENVVRDDAIGGKLLSWYYEHARDLPWRLTKDPYCIWLSEIMLQQTRVAAVIPYYQAFLLRFPNIKTLANAEEHVVLKQWEGLGYYSRARNLHKAAKIVVNEYAGKWPTTAAAIKVLPGIGDYTAGAIASIAFGERVPAVDGNVLRVVSRLNGLFDDITLPKTKREIKNAVKGWLANNNPGDSNQALIELGALVCLPRKPMCKQCCLSKECAANISGWQMKIPVKQPKKKSKVVRRIVVMLFNGEGKVLMRRRTERLLNGLWEFPGFTSDSEPGDKQALKDALEQIGLFSNQAELSVSVQHVFTHLVWNMQGYVVKAENGSHTPEGYQWFEVSRLDEIAIPTAMTVFKQEVRLITGLFKRE